MLKAEIKTGILTKFIDAVTILTDNCRLRANGDGLSIEVIDPTKICMVKARLEKEEFEMFKSDDLTIGLDLSMIIKMLKTLKGSDILSLEYNEEEDELKLLTNRLDFSPSLLPLDSIEVIKEIPSMMYSAEFIIKADDLKQAFKLSTKMGSPLETRIIVNGEDGLMIKTKYGGSDLTYKVDLDNLKDWRIYDRVISSYSLSYLSEISNIVNGDVKIKMGTDYPISISSRISKDIGAIEYVLAPRIIEV